MSIIFITKCLFIYSSLIYSKNLVESSDTSTINPSEGATASEHNFKEVNSKEWPSNIKLFERDSDDNTKTVELPNDKYKVKQDENNKDLFQYAFSDGVNCTLIKNEDKEIWKHDSSKHSGKYPKSFTYNIKDFKIILKCTDLFIVCEKEGDNYKHTEFNKKTPHELSLKATATSDQFDHNNTNKIITFTAKGNYAFNSVKTAEKILWQTDDETEYAKEVVLNAKGSKKKMVTIHKFNNYKLLCLRDGKDKPWYSFDLSKTNAVSMNIGFTGDSFQYTNKLEGETRTFEAADKFVFNVVKYDNTELWTTSNENEYAKEVILEGEGKNEKIVTICKLNNNKVLCVKEDTKKPWQSFDLSKTNAVSVNIAYKNDSFKYTNKLEGETRTFEAKDGLCFNHVRCKSGKNWIDIWKTENENEYSTKVVNEKDNKVTIHLKDGKTKVFKKGTDDKWTEDANSSKKGSGTTPSR